MNYSISWPLPLSPRMKALCLCVYTFRNMHCQSLRSHSTHLTSFGYAIWYEIFPGKNRNAFKCRKWISPWWRLLKTRFRTLFKSVLNSEATNWWTTCSFSSRLFLLKMARNRGLDDLFVRNIESWTQLLTFVDVFTRCALTLLWFVHPKERIICLRVEKQTNGFEQGMKSIGSSFLLLDKHAKA